MPGLVLRKVPVDPSAPVPRELSHVALEVAPDVVSISSGFVAQAKEDGFVRAEGSVPATLFNEAGLAVGDVIEFDTEPAATYKVVRDRGRYCLFCGDKLPDDDFSATPGKEARDHVEMCDAAIGADFVSSDPENPAGYRCDNFVVAEKVG